MRLQRPNLSLLRPGLRPQRASLRLQKAGLRLQGAGLGPQRAGLRLQRPGLRPQRTGLRLQKQAVWSKQMLKQTRERCKRTSKQKSKWPSTAVWILGYSGLQCFGAYPQSGQTILIEGQRPSNCSWKTYLALGPVSLTHSGGPLLMARDSHLG